MVEWDDIFSGEDSRTVLIDAGYTIEETENLFADGIVA